MNKRLLAALTALCLLMALMLGIWQANKPTGTNDLKHITVEVCHKDSTTNAFSYETREEYLGPLLLAEGLISGTAGDYGLFVDTVDGETADYTADGSWWQLSCNGETAQTGADQVVLKDGAQYVWTYTISG